MVAEVLPIVTPDGVKTGLWLIRADGHVAVVTEAEAEAEKELTDGSDA